MATPVEEDQLRSEPRFRFGENWASYATGVGEEQIEMAKVGLRKLVSGGTLQGKRFLDIGCGSGLHTVAAAKLGASEITAIDIDPVSVETTRLLVKRYSSNPHIRIQERSVFDLYSEDFGTFDVVYSWGVLHHTGNLMEAIRRASTLVAERGELVLALYRRTWLCPLWKLEKRWYTRASQRNQERARRIYVNLFRSACALIGRDFNDYAAGRKESRGMDFYHDVSDWLGGYPYESTSRPEIDKLMLPLGFAAKIAPDRRLRSLGLFGSGCDEYTYIRVGPDSSLCQ